MKFAPLPALILTVTSAFTHSAPVGPFDPTRSALADLESAKSQAQKTGKRILVDVGGNWCIWCRRLDQWFTEHKEVRDLRDKHFVVLLVNFSPENKNEKLLSQFPAVKGYPHFFVLDAQGKLLHSQDTGALEEGKGYSREKISAFLKAWSGKE